MNNNKQNQQIKYSNPTAKFFKSLTTAILWIIAIISFAFIVTVLIGDTDTTILKIIVFWGIFAVVIRGVAELIQLLEDLKNKDKRRYTEMNDNDEEKEVLKQLVKEEKEEYYRANGMPYKNDEPRIIDERSIEEQRKSDEERVLREEAEEYEIRKQKMKYAPFIVAIIILVFLLFAELIQIGKMQNNIDNITEEYEEEIDDLNKKISTLNSTIKELESSTETTTTSNSSSNNTTDDDEEDEEEEYEPTLGEQNALKTAKSYLSVMAFSYDGLIEQLEYEGYSEDEATYGADNCGADWYEQAAKKAEEYLNVSSFSRSGLIDQLLYEGFTEKQAEYAVYKAGY